MKFDQDALLAAFDSLAHAAIRAGKKLEIAVYGGSALMLAGNFRFTTEDVDIAAIEMPWPKWLNDTVAAIAAPCPRAWNVKAVDDRPVQESRLPGQLSEGPVKRAVSAWRSATAATNGAL